MLIAVARGSSLVSTRIAVAARADRIDALEGGLRCVVLIDHDGTAINARTRRREVLQYAGVRSFRT